MKRPRVFVVNEPLKRNHNGDWAKAINLGPAHEHGDLVFLLPAGQLPADPSPTVKALQQGLESFNSEDVLLLVGDMRAIAWAVAIASAKTGGLVRTLEWHHAARRYALSEAHVFAPSLHRLPPMEALVDEHGQ